MNIVFFLTQVKFVRPMTVTIDYRHPNSSLATNLTFIRKKNGNFPYNQILFKKLLWFLIFVWNLKWNVSHKKLFPRASIKTIVPVIQFTIKFFWVLSYFQNSRKYYNLKNLCTSNVLNCTHLFNILFWKLEIALKNLKLQFLYLFFDFSSTKIKKTSMKNPIFQTYFNIL